MILRFVLFFFFIQLHTNVIAQTINLQLPQLIETKIPNPPTLIDKQLGTALALSGSTAAIAAHSDDTSDITGSVYIYEASGSWHLTAELTSQHTADNFAQRIVLDDNRLIISADGDDDLGTDSGAVYIFERNLSMSPSLWQQTAKITAPDGQVGDRFGYGIALVENTLYIGAPFSKQGKRYTFIPKMPHQRTGSFNMILNRKMLKLCDLVLPLLKTKIL